MSRHPDPPDAADVPSRRECYCRLCQPSDDRERWDERDRKLVDDVVRHGWAVVGIAGELAHPGWAFTVGLWHTFGSPEVAMFGLGVRDMQDWLNLVGDEVKAGRPPRLHEQREGILEGFPVTWKPVDSSWYSGLFGWMLWFYREPPLPVVQLVWPDRHGNFPWDAGSGVACRRDQPGSWLPLPEHPLGLWRMGANGMDWPFPLPQDALVHMSRRIVEEAAAVRTVVHDRGGDWQFFDAGPAAEDLAVAHLGHLIREHPELVACADLPAGWRAWRSDPANPWERAPDQPSLWDQPSP